MSKLYETLRDIAELSDQYTRAIAKKHSVSEGEEKFYDKRLDEIMEERHKLLEKLYGKGG